MSYLLWHGLQASARQHPDRPAVKWCDSTLSYGELDQASNAFASMLHTRGIGPGHRVGILMPKSHLSVVAMLGVLKSGAAYVPVDPAAPAHRAGFILRDCAVSAVVTVARKLAEAAEFFRQIPELTMIILADAVAAEPPRADIEIMSWREATGNRGAVVPAVGAIESDPAYLLYTSGSTGTPKGVVLSHRHALTFVDWGHATFGVGPADILSNHAPLHFDLSQSSLCSKRSYIPFPVL